MASASQKISEMRNQRVGLQTALSEQREPSAERNNDNPNDQRGEPGRQNIAQAENRCRKQGEPAAEGDHPACRKRARAHTRSGQFLTELRLEERDLLADQCAGFGGEIAE
jgi:hypothetical protein